MSTRRRSSRNTEYWILRARDHHGRAFAIVDKKAARLFVFDAHGRLRGESSALLGQSRAVVYVMPESGSAREVFNEM